MFGSDQSIRGTQLFQRQGGRASENGAARHPELILVAPIVVTEQKQPDPGPYQPDCAEGLAGVVLTLIVTGCAAWAASEATTSSAKAAIALKSRPLHRGGGLQALGEAISVHKDH